MGCCVIGGVAVLGGGHGLAVGGFGSVGLGIRVGGCWWYICYWAGVGFVGWWIVGGGVGLVWVWRVEVTLSVQDSVCDGCRGVAVEGAWLVLWAACGMFAVCGWGCVVGLGCVGRWCCWLFGVVVVGCCVGSEVAMLGRGGIYIVGLVSDLLVGG